MEVPRHTSAPYCEGSGFEKPETLPESLFGIRKIIIFIRLFQKTG